MSRSFPRVSLTRRAVALAIGVGLMVAGAVLSAQGARGIIPPVRKPVPAADPAAAPAPGAPAAGDASKPLSGVHLPDDYVIGADDILSVIFWRDKEMSGDVVVRPDGKITLPLLNDMMASGLTPDQLREQISAAAEKFLEDPAATVVVKTINSRKVYITGEVSKPGPYPLTAPTTVLQLIAMAGGLAEYAKREEIVIMRTEGGKALSYPFDYAAVAKRKKLEQNILLKPGDTVVVP